MKMILYAKGLNGNYEEEEGEISSIDINYQQYPPFNPSMTIGWREKGLALAYITMDKKTLLQIKDDIEKVITKLEEMGELS